MSLPSEDSRLDDRYIGFLLALGSTIFIGASFVIKKKGLIDSEGHGTGESYACLKNPVWWAGTILMAVGEIANFAAYSFAPAILVTPLGAMSVVISAILAAIFLEERLESVGKVGCGLCVIGSIIIVLNAPEEKAITGVQEILEYVKQPGFVCYLVGVILYTLFAVFKLTPKYGRRNMLVFISICSLVGSLSVVACKGLGIALKLTFIDGSNQLIYPSTYLFGLWVAFCIIVQLNYLNKALDLFSTAAVSPVYYVFFTTATIVANLILFQGLEDQNVNSILHEVLGFLIMCLGVFLLYAPTKKELELQTINGVLVEEAGSERDVELSDHSSFHRLAAALEKNKEPNPAEDKDI